MKNKVIYLTTGAIVSVTLIVVYRKWRERVRSNKRKYENKDGVSSDSDKLVQSTLEKIKQLQGPGGHEFDRIFIKDENEVRRKLKLMFEDGIELFQVITDFDRTLSKARHMGKPVPSTHGILERYPEFSQEARQKFNDLRDTYWPIETDPSLTDEEKVPYMEEWWGQAHAHLLDNRVQRGRLSNTVAASGLSLRDGATDFLRKTNELGVPVLIFSAGIGNIIEEVLEQQACDHSNIHVAANYMTFDHQGDLNGFQGQVIHTYNKSATTCSDSEFCLKNVKRRNVVLLGDSTGDRRMADGAVQPSHEANVIRIGFLNDKIPESHQLYSEYFDIVLVDDQTFEIPNTILGSLGQNDCNEITLTMN